MSTLYPQHIYLCLLSLALYAAGTQPACSQNGTQNVPIYHITKGGVSTTAKTKKIIEWGFDQPDTNKLRYNIARMEQAPFDGVVLAAYGLDSAQQPLNLAWKCWSRQAFTREEFAGAVANLKATHFVKFTDNFLRLNVTPGDVDWFDDAGWAAICNNAGIAGWICSEGGLKGIMFDTEQYDKKNRPFSWSELPAHEQHSFEQYRDQARLRGKEFGVALTKSKANLTILMTYADSYQVLLENAPQPYSTLGLLPPFIDGMLDGTSPQTTFVDALEPAYGAKDSATLLKLKGAVAAAGKFSLTPDVYRARMSVGFGLWLDKGWAENGWDPARIEKNYFQPDVFETALASAMNLSDQYVWIYSEKIDWWKGIGVSPLYTRAIEQARKSP